jgi:hypothetical protein
MDCGVLAILLVSFDGLKDRIFHLARKASQGQFQNKQQYLIKEYLISNIS